MRGYEAHEMTAEMLKPAPEDPGSVDINTRLALLQNREGIYTREVGNYPPNVSFVAATYGIIDDGREKANTWVAANPPPVA